MLHKYDFSKLSEATIPARRIRAQMAGMVVPQSAPAALAAVAQTRS
jgi:hypothetical protein